MPSIVWKGQLTFGLVSIPEKLYRAARRERVRMSVKLAEIDPVFLETSYYVVPDRGGEKAYAILFKALEETGHVALARVGMYGREHVVIVRPGKHGMLAHTMFYVDEIRSENEFRTDVAAVGAKELDLAKTFLNALEAPFAPDEFKDQYHEELQAVITKKAAQAHVAPASQASAPARPFLDILEALKKSIAMAQKPSASETQPFRKTPGRVTEIKSRRPSRKAR